MNTDPHHRFGLGTDQEEQALQDLLQFPFVDALFGRRSRRFFRGAEIPDGPRASMEDERSYVDQLIFQKLLLHIYRRLWR